MVKVDKATGALTVLTNILFDAAHGVDATNGAEQPVWDPGTGKFYLSIPEINGDQTNQHGAVLRIAPTGEVEATYPVRKRRAAENREAESRHYKQHPPPARPTGPRWTENSAF